MNTSRRLALLQIGADRIINLFKGGKHAYEMIEGLPQDAEIAGIGKPDNWWYSPEWHRIYIVVQSETFPEVEHGAVIPVLPLILKA